MPSPVTAFGQYNSITPALINKEPMPLQLDSAGNLLVNVAVGAPGGGGGPATIADGADVTQGATTDAAVTSDVNGTLSAKLRGLVKILADAWDSANHRIKVDGSGVTQPVSGTVTVTNFINPLPVTGTFFQATQPVIGTVTATPPYTLGQKSMPSSVPVAIASDQSAIPVSGTFFQATQPVSGTLTVTQSDLSADRTLRNTLEEMNATLRELTDFMYTLRDQFQYVQTPIQGIVQVGNFPPAASSIAVSNLPALQSTAVPDGMQDRVVRNLLEEILVTLQDMRGLSTLNEAARTSVNISSLEGI